MSRLFVLPFAIVLLLLTNGCMWSRARMNDPEIYVRAKAIRPGVTNAKDLPSLLQAQPTRKRLVGDKLTYEYSYSDSKTKMFSILIVTFSRTENVTETLYVDVNSTTGLVTGVPKLRHHEPEWLLWPFDDKE